MNESRVIVDETFTLNVFEDTNLSVKFEFYENSQNSSQLDEESTVNNNYVKIEPSIENVAPTYTSVDLDSIEEEIKTELDDDTIDLTELEHDCFIIEEKIEVEPPGINFTDTEDVLMSLKKEIEEEPPDSRVDNNETTNMLTLKIETPNISNNQSNFCDNVNVQNDNSEIEQIINIDINDNVPIRQENDTSVDIQDRINSVASKMNDNMHQNHSSNLQNETTDEKTTCSGLPNIKTDVELRISGPSNKNSASQFEENKEENFAVVPDIVKLQQKVRDKLDHFSKRSSSDVTKKKKETRISDNEDQRRKSCDREYEETSGYSSDNKTEVYSKEENVNEKISTSKKMKVTSNRIKQLSNMLACLSKEENLKQDKTSKTLKDSPREDKNQEKQLSCNNAVIDLTEDIADVEDTTQKIHSAKDDLNKLETENARRTFIEVQTCQTPSSDREDKKAPNEPNSNSVSQKQNAKPSVASTNTETAIVTNLKTKMNEAIKKNLPSKQSVEVAEKRKKLRRTSSSSEFQVAPASKSRINSQKKNLRKFQTSSSVVNKGLGEENKKKLLERRSSSSDFQSSKISKNSSKLIKNGIQRKHPTNSSHISSSVSSVTPKKQRPVVSKNVNTKIDAIISSLRHTEPPLNNAGSEEIQKIGTNRCNSSDTVQNNAFLHSDSNRRHPNNTPDSNSAYIICEDGARNLKNSGFETHNEAQSSNKAKLNRRNSTNTAQNNSSASRQDSTFDIRENRHRNVNSSISNARMNSDPKIGQSDTLNLHLVSQKQNLNNTPTSRQCLDLKNGPNNFNSSALKKFATRVYKNDSASRKKEAPSSNKSRTEEIQKIESWNSPNIVEKNSLNLHSVSDMGNLNTSSASREASAIDVCKNGTKNLSNSASNLRTASDFKNNSGSHKNETPSSNRARTEEIQQIDTKLNPNKNHVVNVVQNIPLNLNADAYSLILNSSAVKQNSSKKSGCEEIQKVESKVGSSSNMIQNNPLNPNSGLNIRHSDNSPASRQGSALNNCENSPRNKNNSDFLKNRTLSSINPKSEDIQKMDSKPGSNTCSSSKILHSDAQNLKNTKASRRDSAVLVSENNSLNTLKRHTTLDHKNNCEKMDTPSKKLISDEKTRKIINEVSTSTTPTVENSRSRLKSEQCSNVQSLNFGKSIDKNQRRLPQKVANTTQKKNQQSSEILNPVPNFKFFRKSMDTKVNVAQEEVTLINLCPEGGKSVDLEPSKTNRTETQQVNTSSSIQQSPKQNPESRRVRVAQNVHQYPDQKATREIIQSVFSTSSDVQDKSPKINIPQKVGTRQPENSQRVSNHSVESSVICSTDSRQPKINSSSKNVPTTLQKPTSEAGMQKRESVQNSSRHLNFQMRTSDQKLERKTKQMQGTIPTRLQQGKIANSGSSNHLQSLANFCGNSTVQMKSASSNQNFSRSPALNQTRKRSSQKRAAEEVCSPFSDRHNKIPKSSSSDRLEKRHAEISDYKYSSSSSIAPPNIRMQNAPILEGIPQNKDPNQRATSKISQSVSSQGPSHLQNENTDFNAQRTNVRHPEEHQSNSSDEDALLGYMQYQLWEVMTFFRQNGRGTDLGLSKVHQNTRFDYNVKLKVIQQCLWEMIARNLTSNQNDNDSRRSEGHQSNSSDYDKKLRSIQRQLWEIMPSVNGATDSQTSSNIASRIEETTQNRSHTISAQASNLQNKNPSNSSESIEARRVKVGRHDLYEHATRLSQALSEYRQYRNMRKNCHRSDSQKQPNLQNKNPDRVSSNHTYLRRSAASSFKDSSGKMSNLSSSRKKCEEVPQRIESKKNDESSAPVQSLQSVEDRSCSSGVGVSTSNPTSSRLYIRNGGKIINEGESHRIQSSKRSSDHLEERSSSDKKLHADEAHDLNPSLQRIVHSISPQSGETRNDHCDQPPNQEISPTEGVSDERFNETCNTINEFLIGLFNPDAASSSSLPVRLGQYFGPQILQRLKQDLKKNDKRKREQ